MNGRSAATQTIPETDASRLGHLRGKRFLIVNGGYEGKRTLYERARSLGVSMVMLDGPGHWTQGTLAEGLFDDYIEVDLYPQHSLADRALAAVRATGITFDGVATFWDAAGPLTAILAQHMGLPGHSVLAMAFSKDKVLTREVCEEAGIPSPRHYRIRSEADIERAAGHVGFPAVLKPVSGMGSVAVYFIDNAEQLEQRYKSTIHQVRSRMKTSGVVSDDENELIWANGFDMTLEGFLDGEEFDIDLLLDAGEPTYAAVSYNYPQIHGKEIGSRLPSAFPADVEEGLVELTLRCLDAMGFTDGLFHVEAKQTSQGPRLLEVNARLGGDYQYQLNKMVWDVDLVDEYLLSLLDAPGHPQKAAQPLTFLAEKDFEAPFSGVVTRGDYLDGIVDDPRVVLWQYTARLGQRVVGPEEGVPDWLYMIVVSGSSSEEAEANLAEITARIPLPLEREAVSS
jgi:biotin carboxylase